MSFLSSSLASGAQPRSRICGGHFISRFTRSYHVDTHGMTQYPIKDLDEEPLKTIRVIEHGADQIWRIPLDDVVAIFQVDPEHGEKLEFVTGPCH